MQKAMERRAEKAGIAREPARIEDPTGYEAEAKSPQDRKKLRKEPRQSPSAASEEKSASTPIGGVTVRTAPAAYTHITEKVTINAPNVEREINTPLNSPAVNANVNIPDKSQVVVGGKGLANVSIRTTKKFKNVVAPVIPASETADSGGNSGTPEATTKAVVCLLSGQDAEFLIPKNATGQNLFDRVCQFINLQERDYFGIRFMDSDKLKSWLHMEKTIKHQLKGGNWHFQFQVKFYPPKPADLKEDLTRLPTNPTTYAELGSLMVQSELGDYEATNPTYYGNYVSEIPLAPEQLENSELEKEVMHLHQHRRGMSAADADREYLETARRLPLYGVDLHIGKDKDQNYVKVGVSGRGVFFFGEDNVKINRFAWSEITKLSYRRQKFYIKVSPAVNQTEKEIIVNCNSEKEAKRLWKVCVEHHTFFRLKTIDEMDENAPRWPRWGTRKRVTAGRTLAQAQVQQIDRPSPPAKFVRTWSERRKRDQNDHSAGTVTTDAVQSETQISSDADKHGSTSNSVQIGLKPLDKGHEKKPNETTVRDATDINEDKLLQEAIRKQLSVDHDKRALLDKKREEMIGLKPSDSKEELPASSLYNVLTSKSVTKMTTTVTTSGSSSKFDDRSPYSPYSPGPNSGKLTTTTFSTSPTQILDHATQVFGNGSGKPDMADATGQSVAASTTYTRKEVSNVLFTLDKDGNKNILEDISLTTVTDEDDIDHDRLFKEALRKELSVDHDKRATIASPSALDQKRDKFSMTLG